MPSAKVFLNLFHLIYFILLQKLHISGTELEKDVGQLKIQSYSPALFFDLGPLEIIILLLTIAKTYMHMCVRY